jgi:hypothetical protein
MMSIVVDIAGSLRVAGWIDNESSSIETAELRGFRESGRRNLNTLGPGKNPTTVARP